MKLDVLIIGGSLAGAACARELARLGIDAVAFERDIFPRNKVCGGFLSPNTVECLDTKLALLSAVQRAGAVAVDHVRVNDSIDIPLPRPALGISRSALDQVVAAGAPIEQGVNVEAVRETGDGFAVKTNRGEIEAKVIIDAAGKLSRFTRRIAEDEFGVQFLDSRPCGSALQFWFFDDGYGGAVSVEDGQSNFCFLIKKVALDRYVSKPGRLITGQLAYDRIPGSVIAIGDAAGMIDPFCGEGMFHALDSGMVAARTVAKGLRARLTYPEMRQAYEVEWSRRWSGKRLLGQFMRKMVSHPSVVRGALGWKPDWFLNRLWATIPA